MMNNEDRKKIRDLFETLTYPSQRSKKLIQKCLDDGSMYSKIEDILHAQEMTLEQYIETTRGNAVTETYIPARTGNIPSP